MGHVSDIGARASASTGADLFDGLITLAALVLTFLAFDDITTDHSTSFRAEYTGLLACAAWGTVLVVRLAWRGRRALASACTTLLLALLWGQLSIGPGTRASLEPGYLVASAAFLGFLIVAIYLVIIRSLRITTCAFAVALARRATGSGRELGGGDAHPLLPHTGQGAAQALEDAVALGLVLDARGDVEPALRRYERVRSRRTRRLVKLGPRIARVTTTKNPLVKLLRTTAVQWLPASVLASAAPGRGRDPHAPLRHS